MLRLERLTLRLPGAGDTPLLSDIDLRIEPGETVGLTGPSGGGKTLLGLVAAGVIPELVQARTSGRIERLPVDRPFSTPAAVVFQDPSFQLFARSVREELLYTPQALDWPGELMDADYKAAVQALSLHNLLACNPRELSLGEMQRVAVAAALMQRPGLLVLDEPTQYADESSLGRMLDYVQMHMKSLGGAVLLIEHHLPLLRGICERCYVLEQGRLSPGLPRSERLPQPDEPAPARGELLLELRDVTYSYPGGRRALDGLSLDIHRGESLALTGPNGSGKSTLARLVCGLCRPDSGAIRLEGKPFDPDWDWRRRIGYVMQNPDSQLFAATVGQECAFGADNFGLPSEESREQISRSLGDFGLAGYEGRDPFSLSYGQKRRVNIVGVLAYEPELLILDEPTCALDQDNRRLLLDLLWELRRRGKTLIVITHDLEFARAACTRRVHLEAGRAVEYHSRTDKTGEKDVCPVCD